MTDQLLDTRQQLVWGDAGFAVALGWSDETPVALTAVVLDDVAQFVHEVPAIQVLTASSGHTPATSRVSHTTLGDQFRYVSHAESETADGTRLVVVQEADGLIAEWELERPAGTGVIRSSVTVRNAGVNRHVLRAVASWSAGFTAAGATDALATWQRISGVSDWLGEGRWSRSVLRDEFPRLDEQLTGHNPRGALIESSNGTWSTGASQPLGALESVSLAWVWQIEHNGAWCSEIGEDTRGGYLALSGPTEIDASWTRELAPGESFTTVPVQVAVGASFESAVAELTTYRRRTRRPHADNTGLGVVFNDYMNTLNGDPTTAKLLPLIHAAADAGAEIFCIDAGWYDDSGSWWDSVGAWLPSTTRFPGGLAKVIDAIRGRGMVPGLWLEPEVVGVRSSVASELPDEAFLLRRGQRVVEHHRYHLDLRHPAARSHLDAAIDRLVADFGIGFFKFDYNINPGAGTDHNAHSLGDGLLQHNRAHLAWLDDVLDRHPGLVIENCGSGAMRADWAMLSRLNLQSTSDQQEFTRFPPIAAAAPLAMLPEQAASWAYPQPGMDPETTAFCLVTGLLGRFYLSGYLNQMTDASRELVAEAVAAAKALRSEIARATPSWPLGLPAWDDAWVATGLRTPEGELVSVWRRGGEPSIQLDLPHYVGIDLRVETIFPASLPSWTTSWSRESGTLTVHAGDTPIAARTIRLVPVNS